MKTLDILLSKFFDENIIGTRNEIIEYIQSKGIKAPRTTVYYHLKSYEKKRIPKGEYCPNTYFYRKECEEEAEALMQEKKISIQPFVDSFFDENIFGTRNEIIKYIQLKGIKAPRTTVHDHLLGYEKISMPKGIGHPIIYFYRKECEEEAKFLLKKKTFN